MSSIQFTKAARHAVKLKIGVDGPSGSGKTMGALALAHGITRGGRIAVADSENGSAALYADRYDFDTLTLAEADPKFLREVIDAAAGANYDALVIDSLTHAWQFVLNAKDDHDRANPKSNSWTNWRKFAPLWEDLMAHILNAPIHIIATMRSKQAYEQVEKDGRKQVVKLGLQPQVRDGAEYEFGLVFSVNQAHRAEATKDRTALFTDQIVDLCDPEVHASLVGWMNAGGEGPPSDNHPTAGRTSASLRSDPVQQTAAGGSDDGIHMPFGKTKGQALETYTSAELEQATAWIRSKRFEVRYGTTLKAITRILTDRALNPSGHPSGRTSEHVLAAGANEALPFT